MACYSEQAPRSTNQQKRKPSIQSVCSRNPRIVKRISMFVVQEIRGQPMCNRSLVMFQSSAYNAKCLPQQQHTLCASIKYVLCRVMARLRLDLICICMQIVFFSLPIFGCSLRGPTTTQINKLTFFDTQCLLFLFGPKEAGRYNNCLQHAPTGLQKKPEWDSDWPKKNNTNLKIV